MWKRFFKKESETYAIDKYQSSENQNRIINHLNEKLLKIDQSITKASKELVNAQVVGIKIALSKNNNWFENFQKKAYSSNIEKSKSWHTKEIHYLIRERRQLQIKIDKLTGKYWIKRVLKWIYLLGVIIFIICGLSILLMGLVTTLFMIPVWGSILVFYIVYESKANRF